MDDIKFTLENAEKAAVTINAQVNPETKIAQTIINALNKTIKTYGKMYCPCKINKVEENLCPCKEFRENPDMKKCYCGLYVRK